MRSRIGKMFPIVNIRSIRVKEKQHTLRPIYDEGEPRKSLRQRPMKDYRVLPA